MASYYALLADIPVVTTALIREQFAQNGKLATFVKEWPKTIAHLNPDRHQKLISPFQKKSKSVVIKQGVKLSVDFSNTWSCHRQGPHYCGKCSGCISRRQGFNTARISDPTTYLE